MGTVNIREAKTKRELVRFMDFPRKLYRGNPYFVPDMLSSQVADMQHGKTLRLHIATQSAFLRCATARSSAGSRASITAERTRNSVKTI